MENDATAPHGETIPVPPKTREEDAPLMMEVSMSESTPTRSADKFDLMDIEITVYSLTGVGCTAAVTTRKQENRKERGARRLIRNKEKVTTEITNVPITGVVSFRRNVVSSGTMIETYLPSQSLKLPQPKPNTVSKQTASWTTKPSTLLNPENDPSYATYRVKRVMQRQTFQRDLSIRDVSNYAPETIEVKVGVGRGKEVIPLGIASIAITGEEEGEVFTNVPVKGLAPEKGKRKVFRQKAGPNSKTPTKKRRAGMFSEDPNWCFRLEENATLRVGVKVIPSEIKENSEEKALKATDKTLDEILDGLYDENLVIELNDENSLLEQFIGPTHQKVEQKPEDDATQKSESKSPFARFLCGMIPLCADVSTVNDDASQVGTPGQAEEKVRREIKVGSKKTEAIVLSLSLMSSVSESTFGSEIETPVANHQSPGFE